MNTFITNGIQSETNGLCPLQTQATSTPDQQHTLTHTRIKLGKRKATTELPQTLQEQLLQQALENLAAAKRLLQRAQGLRRGAQVQERTLKHDLDHGPQGIHHPDPVATGGHC